MDRKKKKEGGGIYIAICCCVLIIAIVGYANRLSLKDSGTEEKIAQNFEAEDDVAVQNTPIINMEETRIKIEEKPSSKAEKENGNVAVSKNVEAEEPDFAAPVKGNVIEEFSGDDLVYNETLKDWRAHNGVDFAAEMGEKVVCSAPGVVESVFDSNMGRCVIVDHKNGFKTMYANLNEDTSVKAGDELAAGDEIGRVGDTALGDSAAEPHLHFELINNDKNVNPAEYIE